MWLMIERFWYFFPEKICQIALTSDNVAISRIIFGNIYFGVYFTT